MEVAATEAGMKPKSSKDFVPMCVFSEANQRKVAVEGIVEHEDMVVPTAFLGSGFWFLWLSGSPFLFHVHAPEVSEKQTSASSTIIPPLTLQTPEKSVGGKQKRGADLISLALRGSPSEKKPRRNEEEDAASSSPNITEKHRLD